MYVRTFLAHGLSSSQLTKKNVSLIDLGSRFKVIFKEQGEN
jgi:hypothetical protein